MTAASVPLFCDTALAGQIDRAEARLTAASNAATAGCDVVVVTTQPGSVSQRNVRRRGFDLLYTRAILVRPPRA